MNTVRVVDGAAGASSWPSGNYPGRWLWHVDPFVIAAGGDGDVFEFDMVIEDPADPDYVFDVYGGFDAAVPAATITGGFDFDSDTPTIFDWFGVWRVLKTDYEGWGYTFPDGGAYDGAWTGPYDVAETLTLLEGRPLPEPLPAPVLPEPRRIAVEVYERDGMTLLGVLTTDNQRGYRDTPLELGAFSFEIGDGGDDETWCETDNVVRFVVDGVRRFTGVIEDVDKVAADRSKRLSGRAIKVSGREARLILGDDVIYPPRGVGSSSPKAGEDTLERSYNFAAAAYIEDLWTDATELKKWSTAGDPWDGAPAAPEWTDRDAYWIADEGGATPPTHEGRVYLRSPVFTIPDGQDGDYRFEWSADDGARVWVDDVEMAGETRAGLWAETVYFDAHLDAGDHRAAVVLENLERPNPDLNVYGFILSARRIEYGGQSFGPVVLRTDAAWRARVYYSPPPGFTVGQILLSWLGEAQALGGLSAIYPDFTADEDSAGTPWPDKVDEVFTVGSEILAASWKLVEEGLVVPVLDTERMVLHAYVAYGEDISGTIAIELAENIGALVISKQRSGKNGVLGLSTEGRWIFVTDAVAAAAHGRKVGLLDVRSAPSNDAATRVMNAYLRDEAGERELIRNLEVERLGYPELAPLNIVSAPAYDGTLEPRRVWALALSEDAAGNPIFTPELEKE